MKTIHKMIPLAVVVTFAFGSSAVRAQGLTEDQGEKIAKKCRAAATFVNTNDPKTILFRPKTGKGVWWCAVTDPGGHPVGIRASDTNEDGCKEDEFTSDAARLSELIVSNSEVAVDSRTVGLASRIDDTVFSVVLSAPRRAPMLGLHHFGTDGPPICFGIPTAQTDTRAANGTSGSLPSPEGCLYTIARRTSSSAGPERAVIPSTPTTW